jgi:hypothetical protein
MSTYSSLKIELMVTGENATSWGTVTNTNIGAALGAAIAGSVPIVFAGADRILPWADTNGPQDARNLRLDLSGTGGYNLIVPVVVGGKPYIINNGTNGTITVKTAAGTGIAVPAGKTMWVYSDGTDVVDAVTHLTSLSIAGALSLSTALPIASGGTGANTAPLARTALGAAASGTNADITTLNPTGSLTLSPTTGTLVGAPTGGVQGAGTINATGLFVNGVAVGVSGGSVSSVAASGGTTGLTFTGSPITTTGTLTLGGTLAATNGGTGQTTYSSGQLLIGNGSGTLTKATITAGSGITVTNGSGSITIAAAGGSGTVTSVSGSGGTTGLTLTGGPITTTGTLTLGGTLAVANGGTGATSAGAAATALGLGTGSGVQFNSLGVGTLSGATGEIRATNNVTAFYSSDARLKENVAPIENALYKVCCIGGKTFDWTQEYIAEHGGEDGYFIRKSDFGVIAQDVQAVFPVAVRERGDGTLAVDYEKLVAVAFAAIAELKAEVEALKK